LVPTSDSSAGEQYVSEKLSNQTESPIKLSEMKISPFQFGGELWFQIEKINFEKQVTRWIASIKWDKCTKKNVEN
jgi:hypothetical protein